MENELIRIPKLKGIENWAVWKFQARVILQSSDAWSIVDGSSAIPVQGQTIDETTFNRTLAAWKKNDSIAQRIIATTVEEKPLLHILNCKSAKDMWDKLIQVYEQKSETNTHTHSERKEKKVGSKSRRRVWFPCKNQVKTHRDIVFVNQKYQDHQRDNDQDVVEVIVNHPHQEPEHEEQEAPENQKLAESESEMSDEEEDESIHDSLPKTREESEQEQDPVQQDTYSLRDRSKIRNPERFANISILNAEPESFEEATSSGNAEQWKQAMDEEIQSLKQNQTWTLVEPPKNQQVIDNRWVYKIKRKEDGSVQKYKED
ncbi:hypothetical protein GEV33_012448 [Tenebrio molitor]|uniref:Uncharacterized protein n=1 Tax=Tenebrio molitor TaxID=7067 RepID=A0A8J6H983_TENMO|nr:hypothetical protein GEV33_012448 [Tenebrio molitor]